MRKYKMDFFLNRHLSSKRNTLTFRHLVITTLFPFVTLSIRHFVCRTLCLAFLKAVIFIFLGNVFVNVVQLWNSVLDEHQILRPLPPGGTNARCTVGDVEWQYRWQGWPSVIERLVSSNDWFFTQIYCSFPENTARRNIEWNISAEIIKKAIWKRYRFLF